jgi:hypothetical protein
MSTDFSTVQKIVIAPQIVVYRNIFKHSKEIIDLMKNDRPTSFFTNWNTWYEQGFRKVSNPIRLDQIDPKDDKELALEKEYVLEILDCMKFIREDYLNEFREEKGIWPSFIENWDELSDTNKRYWIDYFRYDVDMVARFQHKNLMMEYHVDEFPIPKETKRDRHVATVNFYLNNEYEGGEICVYDSVSNNTYMYKPYPGDAVIMPSTEPFYHGVKPFKNSDRYFLRAFIDYEVHPEFEWKNKYALDINESLLKDVATEESYIEKDLQIIRLSIPANIIEIKG